MDIRYYVTRQRPGQVKKWGYWAPCLARRSKKSGKIEPTEMAKAGFKLVDCGEDGPEAWAVAKRWNDKWDEYRRGQAVDIAAAVSSTVAERWPEGSVGDGYQRALNIRDAERAKNGIVLSREQKSRDDWPRAWKHLRLFGDCDPKTITPEMFLSIDPATGAVSGLLAEIEAGWSVTERHRSVKVWRALWKKMATFGYCADVHGERKDPSLLVANSPPQPRQDVWMRAEVLKRVQVAWRSGYKGLAACIAVAWDSMLSPVDARTLTLGQLEQSAAGHTYFDVDRAKTGKAAAATLSQWSLALLTCYVAELKREGVELLPAAPIFRTPGTEPGPKGGRRWAPQPYSKDLLSKHFREAVRAKIDKTDSRQIQDMRRSGAVEGFAGGATASDTSQKMANTLFASARLQKTYTPVNVASVLRFDEARAQGAKELRKVHGKEGGSK